MNFKNMFYTKTKTALLVMSLIVGSAFAAMAQTKPAQTNKGDGTIAQRLEVMIQKLETMRRSLKSSLSVME